MRWLAAISGVLCGCDQHVSRRISIKAQSLQSEYGGSRRSRHPRCRDLERVAYNRRVLLLDANSRILDSFDLGK
jgi:hypothetical protein